MKSCSYRERVTPVLPAVRFLIAVGIPWILTASPARAESASGDKPAKHASASSASPSKAPSEPAAEKRAKDSQATHATQATPKVSEAHDARASKKKTASRSGGKKRANREPPPRPCHTTPVSLNRAGLEPQSLVLVDCHHKPSSSAQTALSVLARPWGTPKPTNLTVSGTATRKDRSSGGAAPPAGEIAPGVKLLDKGLLARVDAVAHRFAGRPISLVSGYRPQSRGSLHQSAHALDLRVTGIPNQELVAFCRTLVDTGCGYYPNSSFVHIDVRTPGTGPVYWIDASGPGEAPHYVGQWPLPANQGDLAVLKPSENPPDDLDPADEHATRTETAAAAKARATPPAPAADAAPAQPAMSAVEGNRRSPIH